MLRRVALARVLTAVPLLIGVSFLSFLLLHLAPGSFIDRFRLDPAIPEATIDLLNSRFGLDQPWPQQYLSWLAGVFQGDLGFSLTFQRPVVQLLREGAVYTFSLVLSAGFVAFVGGLVLALLAAARPGGFADKVLTALALALVSIPTLVLAVAALGLAAATGAVPIGGGSEVGISEATFPARALDFAHHLVLPAVVLSGTLGPLFFLQARGALMEILPSEFARAARSRGLTRAHVLVRHCLRVALVPLLTFAGSSVGRLLNGAFLVEVVTGWPGMGRLAWRALLARDPFLILGILVLVAFLMLLGNLAADIAVAAADPRIRLEEVESR